VDTNMGSIPATRRRHGAELKAQILEACARPGASVARIALENGLNANLVHNWRRKAARASVAKSLVPAGEFVAVPIVPAIEPAPAADIRISIRRCGTTLDIQWPVADARSCAQWLGEVLK
jgi:transposase